MRRRDVALEAVPARLQFPDSLPWDHFCRTGCFDSPNTASKEFTATHFGAMEARKRKAEVVDLTADHELACRPPKRPTLERHCVIDLSPTVVDLASDAEAAAAPAISCQPHKSLPPSPQVIDSNDDAPADRMALADGHNAALAEISQARCE